ncbi:hypothetical protein F0562_009942 [Nyssa sinensis]|uniref:Late embryogenesis abundant protein LEA-2 subgroup domain-containing protein n=1 Tax=Nyssa sinensis TaxID=561372 RepID=A0A5J4ZZN2_9ASTE|nr:hypothetical protein F0562_009942 [Nyssa sinensis]
MLTLPPPPPLQSPPQEEAMETPLNQIVISKQAMKQQTSASDLPYRGMRKAREQPILRQPRRTNLLVWCAAILCLIFSLLLIFFGIATLIIFLAIKPRNPVFDTAAAALNVIYFDSPEYFNGDFTFLANFLQPKPETRCMKQHHSPHQISYAGGAPNGPPISLSQDSQ